MNRTNVHGPELNCRRISAPRTAVAELIDEFRLDSAIDLHCSISNKIFSSSNCSVFYCLQIIFSLSSLLSLFSARNNVSKKIYYFMHAWNFDSYG